MKHHAYEYLDQTHILSGEEEREVCPPEVPEAADPGLCFRCVPGWVRADAHHSTMTIRSRMK